MARFDTETYSDAVAFARIGEGSLGGQAHLGNEGLGGGGQHRVVTVDDDRVRDGAQARQRVGQERVLEGFRPGQQCVRLPRRRARPLARHHEHALAAQQLEHARGIDGVEVRRQVGRAQI